MKGIRVVAVNELPERFEGLPVSDVVVELELRRRNWKSLVVVGLGVY